MKRYITLALLLLGIVGWSQTTIYTENFGSSASLPTGWSSSNTTTGWVANTSSASSTYTGASGGTNILFNGTGTNGNVNTLTYSNNLSTVGYSNIAVIWGARGTSTFSGTVPFERSSDRIN